MSASGAPAPNAVVRSSTDGRVHGPGGTELGRHREPVVVDVDDGDLHCSCGPGDLHGDQSRQRRRQLHPRRDGLVARGLAHAARVTTAVMGVGAWAPGLSTIYDTVTPADREERLEAARSARSPGASSTATVGSSTHR
jgi:hypothetical protein